MRKWLVLASHDPDNGSRIDTLDNDPNTLERIACIETKTDAPPTEEQITGAFEGFGDGGEFLFVPLDGDTFSGRVEISTRVEIAWKGNYVTV